MKFTKTLKSSICAIAVTAALTVPVASSAFAAPATQSLAPTSVTTAVTTAFPMYGGIGSKWYAIGGTKSALGAPVGNQFGGLRNGGAAQYFQHGAIVWSPATGAKISLGGIRSAWLSTGATNGRLAYPTSDEYWVGTTVRQDYQGGYITWDSRTGRVAVNYPAPAAPAAAPTVDNSPTGAKAFAKTYLQSMGMGGNEYQCLVQLWDHESGWNFTAANPWSGSYGIPQSLPGDKMASAGADWRTNSQTQIKWGVGYIKDRYGSPCSAVNAWHVKGWY